MQQKLIIYTDGGSRGNPGPAAAGVVVGDKKFSKFLGKATNNQAEYEAVILALQEAKKMSGKNLQINLDSQLVCCQLTGKYKVKNSNIAPLFLKVFNLLKDFDQVEFKHIPREKNKQADKLVNQELDKHLT